MKNNITLGHFIKVGKIWIYNLYSGGEGQRWQINGGRIIKGKISLSLSDVFEIALLTQDKLINAKGLLGLKLIYARESMGLNQTQAHQRSGVIQSTISDYEHSKCRPKMSNLVKLAEVYKRDVSFFLNSEIPEDLLE